MPFEEIAHTADWSLRVWAANLAGLFVESARGMYALAGVRLAEEPRRRRAFSLSAVDTESLLVSFLSELLYYVEKDQLAYDHFDLYINLNNGQPCHLSAELYGAPILAIEKVIKAVTYHNLQIHHTSRGMEVEIVFDV
jgi:SHS2 domain-containing protein